MPSNRLNLERASVFTDNNMINIKPPTNATLHASGCGQFILKKAQGPNALSFLKDPIGLAEAIKNHHLEH
jgi:hypothetical protein